MDLHVLVPDTNRKMMPIVAVITPGGGSAEWWSHEGEEVMVVLEGRVLLEIEGSTPVVLERGDSAYYDATRRHRWSNLGDTVARIISVATPPTNL
jgi:quercetin dioxygenase-like cupin family protein